MLLPANYIELIFKALFLYANYFHIAIAVAFIGPFLYRRMMQYEWFRQRVAFFRPYRLPGTIKNIINSLFLVYKIIIVWLLHIVALATIPLLIAYLWNIKTVGVLAKGRREERHYLRIRYNPFKQYHALYRLIEEDKGIAVLKYKDFSYGFWLLIPLFIFHPTELASLMILLLVSFWPFLLQLRLIYQVNTQQSTRLPFLLMLCTFNLTGSWFAYRAMLQAKTLTLIEEDL